MVVVRIHLVMDECDSLFYRGKIYDCKTVSPVVRVLSIMRYKRWIHVKNEQAVGYAMFTQR